MREELWLITGQKEESRRDGRAKEEMVIAGKMPLLKVLLPHKRGEKEKEGTVRQVLILSVFAVFCSVGFGEPCFMKNGREEEFVGRSYIPSEREKHLIERRKTYAARNKRRHFRLLYPRAAAPVVMDSDMYAIEISLEGLRLASDDNHILKGFFEKDRTVTVTLQFHDGQVFDVELKMLRVIEDKDSKALFIAGYIPEGIPSRIVSSEQRYLLRNFPEFCRAQIE